MIWINQLKGLYQNQPKTEYNQKISYRNNKKKHKIGGKNMNKVHKDRKVQYILFNYN